jgi:hypothetical protein
MEGGVDDKLSTGDDPFAPVLLHPDAVRIEDDAIVGNLRRDGYADRPLDVLDAAEAEAVQVDVVGGAQKFAAIVGGYHQPTLEAEVGSAVGHGKTVEEALLHIDLDEREHVHPLEARDLLQLRVVPGSEIGRHAAPPTEIVERILESHKA